MVSGEGRFAFYGTHVGFLLLRSWVDPASPGESVVRLVDNSHLWVVFRPGKSDTPYHSDQNQITQN